MQNNSPPQLLMLQQQHQQQHQHQEQEREQPLAAAFAAAVEEALIQESPQAAKWLREPLGLNDEGCLGVLQLEDGRQFGGISFGFKTSVAGEVVFNTGMVAYPESLTDPSYSGQILTLTYPLVGNYGVPSGRRIHVTALLAADYVPAALSHWKAEKRLGEWLESERVPALWGVDTRALTIHLRESGSMLGKVVVLTESEERTVKEYLRSDTAKQSAADLLARVTAHQAVQAVLSRASSPDALMALLQQRVERAARLEAWVTALEAAGDRLEFDDPNCRNLVAEVSCRQPRVYVSPMNPFCHQVKVLAVDCGMKMNIYRQFLYTDFKGCNVVLKVVPWDYDFTSDDYDGLFISNGPGDPSLCRPTIYNIAKALLQEKPVFGICLGNQLLALAAGAKTYKMKFGNRGMNQPVVDLRTTRCYMTAQNHGYAVDTATLPEDFTPLFVNANDRSNEGISHRFMPYFSVQFHPEASGGPTDTFFLFEEFIDSLRRQQQRIVARTLYTIPYQFPGGFRKVLLLGSGGLSIGQAGEFDYSGSQAIKALKEHNVFVVLVNPNIATVQTSRQMAHRVYFVPVTPQFVTEVIDRERPQGVLCSFGGQTALNCVVDLYRSGILAKYDCQVLGTPIETIIATEDRELFARKLQEIGVEVAPSAAARDLEEAVAAAKQLGYPVLIRAAFALGGLGSGFAEDETSLRRLCTDAFAHSSQVFIDRSLKGWKEIEYEVVRDAKDNCVTICNMENLDPLGIHTGDSIVVAPSQTLSNDDFFRLRECALKVIRHLGIVGECNIQYAVDPKSDKFYIVEVNARLSRSSALASKASGYPLAYIAAKLALVHAYIRRGECRNGSSQVESERKFDDADPFMGSAMKSVGEVMAIGRTFEESLQKALRMVSGDATGFDEKLCPDMSRREGNELLSSRGRLEQELARPSANRIWALAEALARGYSVERLHELTHIDPWFLSKLEHIQQLKESLSKVSLAQLTSADLFYVKKYGFSDRQIATYVGGGPVEGLRVTEEDVWRYRKALVVEPYIKQIDTLAAEFPAQTNYLYLTYHGVEDDVEPLNTTDLPPVLGPWGGGHQESAQFTTPSAQRQQSQQQWQYQWRQQQQVLWQQWQQQHGQQHLESQQHLLHPQSQQQEQRPDGREGDAGRQDGQTEEKKEEQPVEQLREAEQLGDQQREGHDLDQQLHQGIQQQLQQQVREQLQELRELRGHLPRALGQQTQQPLQSPTPEPSRDTLRLTPGAERGQGSVLGSLCSSRQTVTTKQVEGPVICCYVVLGCGCYCIGSSVEFDWSAVSCISTLRSLGHKAIVVNCNPETVSTDYDVSDRLYFEDLTLETVSTIWDLEQPRGMIISVGGQTANNLCSALQRRGVGTNVSSIDCCEDRHKFSRLCDELRLDQPGWSEFSSLEAAREFSNKVGFPVLVRPSYVLSGAAMRVVTNDQQLREFLQVAAVVSGDNPVVISKFVSNAKEVEFDSVANNGEILNYAISEHVENAGTHSGDATLILPAQTLYVETIRRVKKIAQKLARALRVSGPFNIQFICKNNEVKIIECNLRASRTFPFISKCFGVDFIEQATKVMVGAPVTAESIHLTDLEFVCVKVPVFSFSRLRGCDPLLGVEMRSTGEVACFGADKHEAFLKAMVSAGLRLPLMRRSLMLVTGPRWSKVDFFPFALKLVKLGFTIYATEGTYNFLRKSLRGCLEAVSEEAGSAQRNTEPWSSLAAPVESGEELETPPGEMVLSEIEKQIIPVSKDGNSAEAGGQDLLTATDVIKRGLVELVINVPGRAHHRSVSAGYIIRRTAVDAGVPLLTDLKLASFFVESLSKKISRERGRKRFWEVRSWDEYQP
ncbi:carbamoyl phosphate synthetase II, putative [Eimeria necatrix]|uniref:Carbamoyl phosphate synthetase II, putative n=1 Tax=Eimeria necatrix TaxID=51315 RepID=U6MLX5_9EIME|nr:carbamoyl phosphate synthetase II, putative [Eimeria necatrix]CDJ64048.1 carbamoyl phosphate synthetase II, putative [Eimeria necatrix]